MSRSTDEALRLVYSRQYGLTLFAAVCSAFTIYVTFAHFSTQKGWTVCAMSVLSVGVFAGYCWYRVFTEKPVVRPEAAQEPPEGV